MNDRIILGLMVAVVTSCLNVRADDNPAQAAAREALQRKFKELDNQQPQPAWTTPSPVILKQSADPAAHAISSNVAKIVPPSPARIPTNSIAAPQVGLPAVTVTPSRIQPTAAAATPRQAQAPALARTPSFVGRQKPTNEIVTIYGTVYRNAEVEKVEADGIIISYWTSGGGLAMSKIDFEDLPRALREQYKKK